MLGERGWDRFAAAVRVELGATRWYSAIVRAVFDAAADPETAAVGVAGQRAGALERVRFALADLAHTRAEIAEMQTRMVRVLDQLGLTELVAAHPGDGLLNSSRPPSASARLRAGLARPPARCR